MPRLGRHGDTRSPAASGNRRSDAHAFDETVDSRNQSTSEVAHGYEASTLTALGPGGTPHDHVSAGLPLPEALRGSLQDVNLNERATARNFYNMTL